jgi:molybdenum cofactor cytidylyltransferase
VIVGIVLAAGNSRRFGVQDKLLTSLKGQPMAAYSAEAMREATLDARLAVVSNPDVGEIFAGFKILPPKTGDGGAQSSSLIAGVTTAIQMGASEVLIALADMPLVTSSDLGQVASATRRLGGACTVIDLPNGLKYLPPAGFSKIHFDALLGLSGDQGASSILRGFQGESLIHLLPGHLIDIDRPEDMISFGI